MKLIFKIFFTSSNTFPLNKNIELKLEKLLGQGGYGKIYKINEKYVVKYFIDSNNDNYEFEMAKYLNSYSYEKYPCNLIYPIAGGKDKLNNKYIIYYNYEKINLKNINIENFIKKIVKIQLFLHTNMNSLYLDLKPANIMKNKNDFIIIDMGGIINLNNKVNNLIYNLNYNKNEHIAIYQLIIIILYIISNKYTIRDIINFNNANKIRIIESSNISQKLKNILKKIIIYQVDFNLLNKMLKII